MEEKALSFLSELKSMIEHSDYIPVVLDKDGKELLAIIQYLHDIVEDIHVN